MTHTYVRPDNPYAHVRNDRCVECDALPEEHPHQTTVTDLTHTAGYGPNGHGTWVIDCTCGWSATSTIYGKNQADMVAGDHVGHASGNHTRPVFGCTGCRR